MTLKQIIHRIKNLFSPSHGSAPIYNDLQGAGPDKKTQAQQNHPGRPLSSPDEVAESVLLLRLGPGGDYVRDYYGQVQK